MRRLTSHYRLSRTNATAGGRRVNENRGILAHMRARVLSLCAWVTGGSRWRRLWAALGVVAAIGVIGVIDLWAAFGAVAMVGGVITFIDWGYSRFVEKPGEERRQEQRWQEQQEQSREQSRKLDELAARLTAGAPLQPPGQQQQVAEALAAAKEGTQAGDPRLSQALDLLEAGRTVEAAALFRAVAEEKTKRIEQDRLDAAAAWRHAGAIAGLADPKTALDAYRRAVALEPNHAEAQFRLGWFANDAGALATADAAFRQVLGLAAQGAADEHEAAWARLGLGDVLVGPGRPRGGAHKLCGLS
jgi:hypothetical protein